MGMMSVLGLWRAVRHRLQILSSTLAVVPVQPIELTKVRATGHRSAAAASRTAPPPLPSWRLGALVVAWLDAFIGFLAIERTLIARNNQLLSAGNASGPYRSVLRYVLVINAHIWVFSAIGRKTQGDTSYIIFYTAGFTAWNMFRSMSLDARPITLLSNFTKNVNIKWVHLFLADLVWDFAMTMIPFTLTMLFYTIFPVPTLGPPIQCPNFLLLFYVLLIAGTLGAGYGIIMHTAALRFPIVESIHEPLNWVLYITCGIYVAYTGWPWYVAQYLWYNPMLNLVEFCRLALYSGYDVADLSLLYASAVAVGFLFVGLAYRKMELRAQDRR
jgi:ABC-type polysaccharide/polyol phosphate export permease